MSIGGELAPAPVLTLSATSTSTVSERQKAAALLTGTT